MGCSWPRVGAGWGGGRGWLRAGRTGERLSPGRAVWVLAVGQPRRPPGFGPVGSRVSAINVRGADEFQTLLRAERTVGLFTVLWGWGCIRFPLKPYKVNFLGKHTSSEYFINLGSITMC